MKILCPKCGQIFSKESCGCGYGIHTFAQFAMALPEQTLLADRYVIRRVLGAGGFGITYYAFDRLNQSFCAIKEFVPVGVVQRERNGMLMPEAENRNRVFLHAKERFMEEAMTLKRLSYIPQVVAITDYFTENNSAYFVMEFIRGKTLRQIVGKEGKMPIARALSIIRSAGNALECIHSDFGIFHRDISPENIMLDENDKVKLIDFGSAKDLARRTNQLFTIVLKAGYAPPEQYSSTTPQGRYSDVYALAGTLYYLLSGKNIPDAPSRINGAGYPSLKTICPEVSSVISDAVDQALLLNRKNRTQTVAEFLRQLDLPPEIAARQAATGAYRKIRVFWRSRNQYWKLPVSQTVAVGRAEDAAIRLPNDARLSKSHLLLCYDPGNRRYLVRDVSTNGVYYQGIRLQKNQVYSFSPKTRLKLCADACEIVLE